MLGWISVECKLWGRNTSTEPNRLWVYFLQFLFHTFIEMCWLCGRPCGKLVSQWVFKWQILFLCFLLYWEPINTMVRFTAITLLSLQGPTKVCMYVYIWMLPGCQVFAPYRIIWQKFSPSGDVLVSLKRSTGTNNGGWEGSGGPASGLPCWLVIN